MPSYLVLADYTDQGVRSIKESPKRLEGAKQAAQAAGGRLVFFYLTMGEHDIAALFELPSDEAMAQLSLGLASQGNIRTTTLKAFTEEEFQGIIGGLP